MIASAEGENVTLSRLSQALKAACLHQRVDDGPVPYICRRQQSGEPIRKVRIICVFAILLGTASQLAAQGEITSADSALAYSIWRELIAIRSVSGSPATRTVVAAVARRLDAAGFSADEVTVGGPSANAPVLVARLRGSGKLPPMLLIAHLDVVDALRGDWSTDPFTPTVRGGWMYGRGSSDDKAGAAAIIANLIILRKSGLIPKRDVIAVLTTDEETTSEGITWAVTGPGRKLLGNPSLALNLDEGEGILANGRETQLAVQTSEKVYQSYILEVKNRGGHSSLPRTDNAIYSLARGLEKLGDFTFPVKLNETTREFFDKQAAFFSGQEADDMRAVSRQSAGLEAVERLSGNAAYNAILRTTCVATRLEGGHADNALAQTARATVNCRVLPGESVDAVDSTLRRVVADSTIRISRIRTPTLSPPSPLNPELFGAIRRVTTGMWPTPPIVGRMDAMSGWKSGVSTR